ncbi:MAG: HIT family protein [Erysipelotrichaceae bacterium]|nr:HIT family protein [Erysipelotrichaceae bacterium]MDY6034075.1 HIT family protein [Bulleidia sp.]
MCVFCDIITHQIPSKVVYEDDNVLAILDISQVTYGHTIVMPKKHVENIIEADSETIQQCASVVSTLAKQIVKNTKAAGCNVLNNCGEVAGQTVQHLHFHIIPRYSKDDACKFTFEKSKPQDLDEVLKTVKG